MNFDRLRRAGERCHELRDIFLAHAGRQPLLRSIQNILVLKEQRRGHHRRQATPGDELKDAVTGAKTAAKSGY
jgi:hypothetical protein